MFSNIFYNIHSENNEQSSGISLKSNRKKSVDVHKCKQRVYNQYRDLNNGQKHREVDNVNVIVVDSINKSNQANLLVNQFGEGNPGEQSRIGETYS